MKRLACNFELLEGKYVSVWVDNTTANIASRFSEGHTPLYRREDTCVYYGKVYSLSNDKLYLNPGFRVPDIISIPEKPQADEVLELRMVGEYTSIRLDDIVAITLMKNKNPKSKK